MSIVKCRELHLKNPEAEVLVTFSSFWQQAKARQETSGLFAHRPLTPESCTMYPQGPGGSEEASPLPQHACMTYLKAPKECLLLFTGKWMMFGGGGLGQYLLPLDAQFLPTPQLWRSSNFIKGDFPLSMV